MRLFKQKHILKSVANGEVIPLDLVNDEVFSSRMMGNGFAIIKHDGHIFSPVDGEVVDIFPTKHAITIRSKQGDTMLIHMGVDTVDLKGKPFEVKVSKGERVTTNTLINVMDLDYLREQKKDETVIVVIPDEKGGNLLKSSKPVVVGDDVFKL